MICNPVELPAKKGHAASAGEARWSPYEQGWRVEERSTGNVTRLHPTEEKAIGAARRREWEK